MKWLKHKQHQEVYYIPKGIIQTFTNWNFKLNLSDHIDSYLLLCWWWGLAVAPSSLMQLSEEIFLTLFLSSTIESSGRASDWCCSCSSVMALLEQSSMFWNIWATSSQRWSACSAGRTMALSWVTRDCPLAISFIADPWSSQAKEGWSDGEDWGRCLLLWCFISAGNF